MSKYIKRLFYLKQLYFNVGKSILTTSYDYCERYINYTFFENQYNFLKKIQNDTIIIYCDRYNAFFSLLLKNVIANIYPSDDAIYIMSPYYNKSVIDCVFIPKKNIKIINICTLGKEKKLYTNPHINFDLIKDDLMYLDDNLFVFEKNNIDIAFEFFKKAEKI